MRSSQVIKLVFAVLAGVVWVFIAQNWIFLNIFPGIFAVGGGLNLVDYLQTGSSPSFRMLWISCITALLIWLYVTWRSTPRNSAEVRRMQPLWWIAACILVGLGWLYQVFFTVFRWTILGESPIEGSGMNFYPLPPGGWILVMVFVVLDVVILFWLPTLLASPRNYRFVVPGAVRILGGR